MNEILLKVQAELIAKQQEYINILLSNGANTSIEHSTQLTQQSGFSISTDNKKGEEKEITLAEYAKDFMESRKSNVKPSTYQSYMWMLKKTILPQIGDIPLYKIDNKCLQGFADECLKTYSRKSTHDLVGLVKTILTDACIDEIIEPKKIIIKYPKEAKEDYKVLTEKEFAKLEEYLFDKDKPHDIGELILLETGMRVGEMCGLTWADIDTDKGMINIKRTVQRIYKPEESTSEINIGATKTSAGNRIVPIGDNLKAYLLKNRKKDSVYVASGRETPTEPRTHRQYHKSMLRRVGIDYIKLHGYRHTFATRAIQKGVDPKTVSAILGHANSNITLNIYTSVTDDMLKQGIEKMNN